MSIHPNLDLKTLAVFVAVVRHGSFAAAADELNMHPTTVGNHVRELEKSQGAKLLDQTVRPARPTSRGERLHQEAQDLLRDAGALKAKLRAFRDRPAGEVRLEASTAMTKHLILPIWPRFTARYPDVELRVSHTGRFQGGTDTGYDLMIRRGAFRDTSLVARILGATPRWIVASPAYLAANPRPIRTPEDLLRHDCIMHVDALTRRVNPWVFGKAPEIRTLDVSGRLVCCDGQTPLVAALAGAGVTQSIRLMAGEHVAAGRLVRLLPDVEVPDLPISLLYNRNEFMPARVRCFVEFLLEAYEGHGASKLF